jgi:hypothetical protein
MASLLHYHQSISMIPLVKGVFTMTEFIVAIDHVTYYAVRATDEVTAIDLALEGEGQEISSETREASICEYEGNHPRRHG